MWQGWYLYQGFNAIIILNSKHIEHYVRECLSKRASLTLDLCIVMVMHY